MAVLLLNVCNYWENQKRDDNKILKDSNNNQNKRRGWHWTFVHHPKREVNKRHTWITVKIAVKQNQPAPTSTQCWDLFPSTWCMEFLSHYTHKLVFFYFQSVSTTLWVPGTEKEWRRWNQPVIKHFSIELPDIYYLSIYNRTTSVKLHYECTIHP